MTIATLSIDITCPDWCVAGQQQHLDDLDNIESCIHRSAEVEIVDRTHGPGRNPIEGLNPAHPIVLDLSAETRLDGREKASPCVFIDGHEHSIEQALALADAIRDLVEVYRLAGGVA